MAVFLSTNNDDHLLIKYAILIVHSIQQAEKDNQQEEVYRW